MICPWLTNPPQGPDDSNYQLKICALVIRIQGYLPEMVGKPAEDERKHIPNRAMRPRRHSDRR